MRLHVDPLSTEADAFHPEPQALLVCCIAAQLDLAAGADDALPGQRADSLLTQKLRDRSMVKRIARSSRHLAVGRYLSLRNRPDDAPEGRIALLVLA